jgi:hypothetical protein
MNNAESWYSTRPGNETLYQGDVLEGIPIVVMPPASSRPWTILKPSPPVTREQALAGSLPKNFYPRPKEPAPEVWAEQQELVLAKGTKTKVILATQSCDLERRNYFQVVPIYSVGNLHPFKLASLRSLDVLYMFYLPGAEGGFPESYADLTQIVSVHKSYFKNAVPVKCLSAKATILFQAHLAEFFGRPFGFNTRDLVPETGAYTCVNCFHTKLSIQTVDQVKSDPFKGCPGCGDDALWLKLP